MSTPIISRRSLLASVVLGPGMALLAQSANAAATTSAGLRIRRLAWAGIQLELGNTTLFIDARSPDPANGAPGPALASSTDRTFALATHHHGDHCDLPALQKVLGDRGYLVVFEQTARLIDNRVVNVEPAQMYEPAILPRGTGEFVAWAVPAVDGLGSPQVSWVIDAGGKRMIHCGDTIWHGYWWNIARAYGPFDYAFLPINGFRQTGGLFSSAPEPMGLTPDEAVEAAVQLKTRTIVPIHFGNNSDPNYREVPHPLASLMEAASKVGIAVEGSEPGARILER